MWPAILGAVTGIAGGIADFFGNRETNETNKTLTRETNQQNEALMREQWAREDNAVSRRAEDLQNAGLSKTLAAGSGAGAGSLATMQRPEYTNPTSSALDTAYRMMSMVQDFQKRQYENKLIASQAKNIDTKTAGESISNAMKNYEYVEKMPIDRDIKQSILDKNLIEIENMRYNLLNFGSTKGPSTVAKPFYDALSFLFDGPEGVRTLKNMFNDIGKGQSQGVGNMIKYLRNLM